MRYVVGVLAIAASIGLSACGGGGGTTPSASVAPGGGSGSPGASASPGSPSSNSARAAATFHVTIPAPPAANQSLRRRPQYIGADTNELYISAGDLGNFAPVTTSSFGVDATNCTTNSDGSKSCTFTAQEPVGSLDYAFLGVNIANGVSSPLELDNQVFEVTAGQNALSATLSPILAAVSLTAVSQSSSISPFTLTLSLTDAASMLIPTSSADADLANLPTIVDTDASGQTFLGIPQFSFGSSVQPVSLSQTQSIILNYVPSSVTAPVDSFNIVVNTIGFSVDSPIDGGANFFPQATPVPADIPAMSTTYGVVCSPQNPLPTSPTYQSGQPPVCYLTAPVAFTVN